MHSDEINMMDIHLYYQKLVVCVVFLHFYTDCTAFERPNIVLIVADDLGWNDVSFHGSDQIITPNIDALASKGIILNNYYVSPICTPTRGALMTGRHPIHTGLQSGVIVGSQRYGLPLSEKLLPQWLAELGYQNHMVGKWHLGMFAEEYLPTRRGFTSHYGYLQGAEGYFDHTYAVSNDGEWGLDWRRNDDIIRDERELYSTELFTKEAVKHIEQHNKSQPLFLYVAHQAVHRGNFMDPLLAPQKYVNRFPHIQNYKRKLFAGMVAALDDSVGMIVDSLRSHGMLENTVLVFTTDNGGPANGFDDNAANNFPLRGVKTTLWEGGVRGTGFIYSPLLNVSGYTSNHMMHVCDWLPTLYTAAGGDAKVLTKIDGYNMWETLSENDKSPRTQILHNIDPQQNNGALRMGDYKLLVGDVGMAWDGWYPPWQNPGDGGQADDQTQPHQTERLSLRGSDELKFEKFDVKVSATQQANDKNSEDSTGNMLQETDRKFVKIKCGKKPLNASTNCDPVKSPCLFNIRTDPCEYNNIADDNKQLVIEMMVRMTEYMYTMVPPANQPTDPAGDPIYHNQTWVPWVKL